MIEREYNFTVRTLPSETAHGITSQHIIIASKLPEDTVREFAIRFLCPPDKDDDYAFISCGDGIIYSYTIYKKIY